MCLQISVLHFLSIVRTFARCLNFCTCLILASLIHNFANNHAFCVLAFLHYHMLELLWFHSISAISTVSFAYLMLRLWPQIMNPGWISTSHRIASLYRLSKYGEKTYPSLTSLSIFVYLLNSFSTCIQAVCCQSRFLIILTSFSTKSKIAEQFQQILVMYFMQRH